ncbi:DUF4351 domain-containing protein [Nostoc sp. CHAB 5844]|nr:DUF4351 domain-containing protein [Nostoc sp. CHAB 5844]
MSFDNVCKILAEKYPAEFINWLLAEEPTKVKVLKTELSLEPIRADSVSPVLREGFPPQATGEPVRVTFLQTANRILHIEFQTRTISHPPLLFRMLDYSVRLIRQFLSEDVMQESVIYQDILQKGQQQGKEQGKQEEAFRFLMRQLTRRFGEIDSSIIERIRVLSTEQLEELGEEFVDFSAISDLVALLEQPENS